MASKLKRPGTKSKSADERLKALRAQQRDISPGVSTAPRDPARKRENYRVGGKRTSSDPEGK
jgi:hypothetical protein